MKYYGENYYKEYIDSRYDLAVKFGRLVNTSPDFELAIEPESNIVCFRFAPQGHNDLNLNKINSEIREKIIKDGSYYIVQAELNGKLYIRLTIINPVTIIDDLKELLKRIHELGILQIDLNRFLP
jgi:L-2,4-diaminobutyrate decarboxylase